jgi:DHA2 family multidrug resistance protein
VEHLTPFDRSYQLFSEQTSKALHYSGAGVLSDYGGLGIMYKELIRQASMLSFNDAFHIVSILMICVLPFVMMMKRAKGTVPGGMH